MAKARAHSAEPLGNAIAMMEAMLMTATMPRGSIPETEARTPAIIHTMSPVRELTVSLTVRAFV